MRNVLFKKFDSMGMIVQINGFGEKVTSNKETVLYGRVTKKKNKGILTYTSQPYNYKETFKSAFVCSGIGMALIGPEGGILDVNNAFCTYTGYTKTELLQYSFLDLGHPDDNEHDKALLQKIAANELNYYSLEKRYISKCNKVLWGLHTVSKVCDNTGDIEFYVLQVLDTTHHQALTGELNRQNSELEVIRTGLINKIAQQAELKKIIGHDLRGSVNNIKLLAEMLKEVHEKKDGQENLQVEIGELIDYLNEGSGTLTSNLNTLTDVVQAGMRKDIPYDDCDVYLITHKILGHLNSTIFETGAFVQLDIDVPVIKYPKVFLESILYTLISNALKYISPGRIPEIQVRTYSLNDGVTISVKDNGLGIDLAKYGNNLFKLDQTFHPNGDSKGVGLYILKAQVESLGGTIQVKSKENEGAEFIVIL